MGGIVCFLLTRKILCTRQGVLAGLQKTTDTESSEHTDLSALPRFPPPGPTDLLTTLASQSEPEF